MNRWTTRWAFAFALALASAGAMADTLGPLPASKFELEMNLPHPAAKEPKVYVFRTSEELEAGLNNFAPKFKKVFNIDFEKFMVVGATDTSTERLRIYRIELDDATKPTKLLVRTMPVSSWPEREGTYVHLVVTPTSTLPVSFLADTMVDAGIAGMYPDGVESKSLGETAGVKPKEGQTAVAGFREQAEQLAIASLSRQEIDDALKVLNGRVFGKRFPQPYSTINVERDDKTWRVTYDKFKIEVDVSSGKVTRVKD